MHIFQTLFLSKFAEINQISSNQFCFVVSLKQQFDLYLIKYMPTLNKIEFLLNWIKLAIISELLFQLFESLNIYLPVPLATLIAADDHKTTDHSATISNTFKLNLKQQHVNSLTDLSTSQTTSQYQFDTFSKNNIVLCSNFIWYLKIVSWNWNEN